MSGVVASGLVQGNQPLFNKCERYLADRLYDGNTLNCFYTERRKRNLAKYDLDSSVNSIITQQEYLPSGQYLGWTNADGSESGFQIDTKKINRFVIFGAIVGLFILLK
jgi:hypothetical protein